MFGFVSRPRLSLRMTFLVQPIGKKRAGPPFLTLWGGLLPEADFGIIQIPRRATDPFPSDFAASNV
jgi:hypothetical protein